MRDKLKILPKIFLIVGFGLLFFLVKYQGALKNGIFFNNEKFKTYFNNFFFDLGSGAQRHRPLTFEEKETELRLYIGDPFRDFERRDWEKFWNIIYGGFLKQDLERPDLPKRKRQLTEGEIIEELISRYPTPFTFFTESHWQTFFGIIFKK